MGLGRTTVILQGTQDLRYSETLGTMSVGPGVKPVTPALPLAPNKLKLLAVTMLLVVCYFRRDGRLIAGDQAIVKGEGSGAGERLRVK